MTTRPAQLSCIGCGRQLDPSGAGDEDYPSCGTRFTSGGHYGSTSFDPQGPARLAVVVCDPCLVKHSDRVRHSDSGDFGSFTAWEPSAHTVEWVAYQAATHTLPVGFPLTLTDGTVIEYVGIEPLVGTDETGVVLRIDGISRTRRAGGTFKSRTNTCHITAVHAPAPGHRTEDPWYPALTLTEGEQPTFEEWCATHR